MINQTSHLDRLFPSMLTPYILENVFRINVAFNTRANKEIVMRTFPAYNINTSYSFDSAATDNPQGIVLNS